MTTDPADAGPGDFTTSSSLAAQLVSTKDNAAASRTRFDAVLQQTIREQAATKGLHIPE